MYITPLLFPQFSNREDFLAVMQLFDDDTFTPINLHRCSTFNNAPFTGSAWTVTDGAIFTTSITPITIPVFPIGAQLSALSLTTVDLGLGILPGDPITIADTPTGLNTMTGYVTSYSPTTGALVCQIGLTYQCEIRKMPPNWQPGLGYISWYDFGIAEQAPILQASLANGEITVIDMGTLQIRIPESIFRTLRSGTYGMSMTGTDGFDTRQFFIGRLPVIWGGASI